MRFLLFKIISLAILFLLTDCKKKNENEDLSPQVNEELTPYNLNYPNYFPALSIPSNNPLTLEGINLGRKLYYDTILSNDGKTVTIYAWYDNEFGYTCQVVRLAKHVAQVRRFVYY